MALFRAGSEEAFRTMHDRYRVRLFAYARQMLGGSRQDAEDALQDVFVRAYSSLRAHDRPIVLRAWLYRVAHNRCIDQLRRPRLDPDDLIDVSRTPQSDPSDQSERREQLRRLVSDVARLPEQQRSALLMRELQGLTYEELADALQVSVAAVKSLLVRARGGLVDAAAARDATCDSVRGELALACDRGLRASGLARRHMRDCADCADYREELRGVRRRIAALTPFGPLGMLGHLLGVGGSATAASGAQAAVGGSGALITATKVALVAAAAAVTAGSALGVTRHAGDARSSSGRGTTSLIGRHAAPSMAGPSSQPLAERTASIQPHARRATATAPSATAPAAITRRQGPGTKLSMGRRVRMDLGAPQDSPSNVGPTPASTSAPSDSTVSSQSTPLSGLVATGSGSSSSSTGPGASNTSPSSSSQPPIAGSTGSGAAPGSDQTPGTPIGGPTATASSGTPPPASR